MFDYWKEQPNRTSKALTICAIGMGVGFGTCGLGLLIGHYRITPYMASAGSIVFFISALGTAVILLFMLARAIVEFFRR